MSKKRPILLSAAVAQRTSERKRYNSLPAEIRSLHTESVGHVKTYTPSEEGGQAHPTERRHVRGFAREALLSVMGGLQRMWELEFTNNHGNMSAKADIVVGDVTLAKEVPVTSLMYSMKELAQLRTLLEGVAVRNQDHQWGDSRQDGAWRSEPVATQRTATTTKYQVIREACVKEGHAFNAEIRETRDTNVVGTWQTVNLSGALSPAEKAGLLDAVDELLASLKAAIATANNQWTEPQNELTEALLNYVFKSLL